MVRTRTGMSALGPDLPAGGPENHYEVWASSPAGASAVGGANTLLGALVLYVRARRAQRNRTINVLVNGLPANRGE